MAESQFALDFSGRLPVSAQIGMATADEHADKFWKKVLDGVILAVARKVHEFTVDEVLDELELVNEGRKAAGERIVETHNLCAVGPAMTRAFKDGIIKPTGRYVRSKKPIKNANIHAVWESNFK